MSVGDRFFDKAQLTTASTTFAEQKGMRHSNTLALYFRYTYKKPVLMIIFVRQASANLHERDGMASYLVAKDTDLRHMM